LLYFAAQARSKGKQITAVIFIVDAPFRV